MEEAAPGCRRRGMEAARDGCGARIKEKTRTGETGLELVRISTNVEQFTSTFAGISFALAMPFSISYANITFQYLVHLNRPKLDIRVSRPPNIQYLASISTSERSISVGRHQGSVRRTVEKDSGLLD